MADECNLCVSSSTVREGSVARPALPDGRATDTGSLIADPTHLKMKFCNFTFPIYAFEEVSATMFRTQSQNISEICLSQKGGNPIAGDYAIAHKLGER